MKEVKKVQFNLDPILYQKFKAYASLKGKTMTDFFHEWMEDFIEEVEEEMLTKQARENLEKAKNGEKVEPLHVDRGKTDEE